ncbi:hypothetical protein [Cryptosporangium sp. NPDC048952]|uniref:hypothetical protein n=1 Tax=Cryptosporangium sp. NPDC048952 TaxID=3363961 RepID=UPI003718C837
MSEVTPGRTFADKLDQLIDTTIVPGIGKGEGERYSHAQIGRAVGVSGTTVTNWRLGTSEAKSSSRRRLEEFFGLQKFSLDDGADDADVQSDPQAVKLREALGRPGVAALAMRLGDMETADLHWVEAILDARQQRLQDAEDGDR